MREQLRHRQRDFDVLDYLIALLCTFDVNHASIGRQALCTGDALLQYLLDATNGKTFAQLDVDRTVIAANLLTKRELQFSKKATQDVPIALAARASASISIVFAPVAVAGGSMVDGGTCNNMPVNDLTALDSLSGASIVRVPTGYASSFDRHMPVATRQRLYGDG
ncbi:hypothetical protein WK59_18065 [Burkholderia ubonensis]|nr:hypothetical protein WK59_18065 [Burkholderia ubonensis]